jgi:hypothetical protein
MSGSFMISGVCPVCGKVTTIYNPCVSMCTDLIEARKNEEIKKRFPHTVFRCYHNGTPYHDNKNISSSAGTLYAMHLYFRSDTQKEYHRCYPDANDDCNKRHWKVK